MKLQRTTLILILLAIGLGGFVYFSEMRAAPQRAVVKSQSQKIFTFAENEIQELKIQTQEQTLNFERVEQKPGDKPRLSQWQMKVPRDTPANDPYISFLLNLLVEGKSDRTLTVSPAKLQEYGLDKPLATIEVKLKDGKTHKLILGKPDFNRSFLYAQADPGDGKTQDLEVSLVQIDFEYAVKRPLSEWQETKAQNPEKKPPEKSDQASPSPTPTN